MDLQAILDGTDSSSVSSGPDLKEESSNDGDLERILREEEFSDEGLQENDMVTTAPSLSTISTAAHHYLYSCRPPKLLEPMKVDEPPFSYEGGVWCGTTTDDVAELPRDEQYAGSHNAEDWAVLQQILGEEDNEDDTDDWADDKMDTGGPVHRDILRTSAENTDVDAILDSIRSDDADDDFHAEPTTASQLAHLDVFTPIPDADATFRQRSKQEYPVRATPSETEEKPSATPGFSTESALAGPLGLAPKYRALATEPQDTKAIELPSEERPGMSDVDQEAITEAALKHAQAYERRLLRSGHRDIVSPLQVKRRMKPRLEVGTREQQKATKDKPAAHHANAQLRFEFSGLMESKSMSKLSSRLLNPNSNPGLPTALAVNSKFIAVGFQKGVVWIFDLFEELRQRLGSSPEQIGSSESSIVHAGSVTSIDMTMNGEALISGYTSGNILLWDIIKGTILRSITDTHPSPITSLRFVSDRDMKAVSVDAGGLVHKYTFTKNIIWSNYSMDTECLLDGTAGQILAMDIMPALSSVESSNVTAPTYAQHPFLQKLVLIALSSERSSFAVAVEPVVNVLHRWAKPSPERIRPPEDASQQPSTDLPCLSWGWALVSGGGHIVRPILARSWGCCLQLLQANFPEDTATSNETEVHLWPAFGVHDEFDATAPVVSLEWLGERSLVYLTVANEFTVVDTVVMTLLERLDFSGLKLVYAEFSLSRGSRKDEEVMESPEFCTTFQNSVRSSDNRILVLCQEEVKSVSIVDARRRISTLEQDGEWLEALAVALDHYENTIKSQEDRRRDPDGKRDLSKHPEFSSTVRSEDEEWISQLLLRYLRLAFDNAPESDISLQPDPMHLPSPRIDLVQSHFQMLAGVCVEFCVVTRRLDILFGPIFRRFNSVGYTSVFLDVLEPYVLNDKLDYIAPEAMAHFVEHCKANNGVATVERCLLHMDVTIMDFDSILSLLRKNEMYSALIHVYTHGLDDFIAPLEILFERVFDAADDGNVLATRRSNGVPQNPFERFGYKAILYLRHCFNGKTFPQELDLKPDGKAQSLRPQLLNFLQQEKYAPSRDAKDKTGGTSNIFGHRALQYPYAHVLLMVDAKAVLDTIILALDAPDAEFVESERTFECIGGWEVEVDVDSSYAAGSQHVTNDKHDTSRFIDRQQIISILSSIVVPDDVASPSNTSGSVRLSKAAVDAFLDFLAKYLMDGVVRTSKSITFLILSRMADRFVTSNLPSLRRGAQEHIIELLTALPSHSYSSDDVLELFMTAGIHRAALLLHQEAVSSWYEGDDSLERRSEHLRSAIDCYLADDEPEFCKNVFAYVKKECTGAASLADSSDAGMSRDTKSNTLRGALAAKLPDLVELDPLLTAQLVAELYIDELDDIVASLHAGDGGVAQFRFLHSVISGDLTKADAVAGPVLSANLTMDHHQIYLALMAQLHPHMVYQYLSTHDNYRPEECLKLCQEHDIADASAYLLERMGNELSALQLVLQTLDGRLMGLKRIIRGLSTDSFDSDSVKHFSRNRTIEQQQITAVPSKSKKGREVEGVKQILIVALDLCERNSGTTQRSEHGSRLWFNVLDRLINAKSLLRLAKEKPEHAKIMAGVLSELLQMTMQRMVSSVPLPDLVRKVTTDHSGSRLGEFREMIVSMLSTYGFELDVCKGAVNVMHHDVQCMEKEHRSLKLEGSRVQSIMRQPLSKSVLFGDRELIESLSHYDANLELGDTGDASFSNGNFLLESRRHKMGLGNALTRLRSRRDSQHVTATQGPWHRTKSGLSFMTINDELYQAGESSEAAYFGDRYVGVLGVAEHCGSFR